jgi:hypothetical protein
MKHVFKIFLVGVILLGQLNVVEARRGRIVTIKKKPTAVAAATTPAAPSTTEIINTTLEAEIGKLKDTYGALTDSGYKKSLKRAMYGETKNEGKDDEEITFGIDRITAENFSAVKTNFDAFVEKAIKRGADYDVEDDKNRIFVIPLKRDDDKKSLVALAILLAGKKAIIGNAAKDIFTKILEEQAEKIPGKNAFVKAEKYIDFINIIYDKVLSQIPANIRTDLIPAVQSFITSADNKGTTTRRKEEKYPGRTLRTVVSKLTGFGTLTLKDH